MKTVIEPFNGKQSISYELKLVLLRNGIKFRDNVRIISICKKGEYNIVVLAENELYEDDIYCFKNDGTCKDKCITLNTEETIAEVNDFIVHKNDSWINAEVAIIKRHLFSNKYIAKAKYTGEREEVCYNDYLYMNKNVRLATKEEKEALLKRLNADGKYWNAKKKCINNIPSFRLFKEGQSVLVRNSINEKWELAVFKVYDCTEIEGPYVSILNNRYTMCVDYISHRNWFGQINKEIK